MITAMDRKLPRGFGKDAFFDIFHMGTIYTNWDIMFAFTCNSARMAPDTQPVIYNKTVAHFMKGLVDTLYTLCEHLFLSRHHNRLKTTYSLIDLMKMIYTGFVIH